MSRGSTKQRMISAADERLPAYVALPDEVKPTALWMWLNFDPWGRAPMDLAWIGSSRWPGHPLSWAADRAETHLLSMLESGFIATYEAEGAEWIALLHPLKCDTRRTDQVVPEPPSDRPWTSTAMGGAGARERAREQVRAEGAARASAWDAVAADRERLPEKPDRPYTLDAPPAFCPDHMPAGAGKEKCGPCRDARIVRDQWLTERIYEEKLTHHFERTPDDEPW